MVRAVLAGLAVLALALAGCPGSAPTACQIGDTIYRGGALNPADDCQSCQPAVNSLQWTIRSGVACDAGSGPDTDAGSPPDTDAGIPPKADGGPPPDAGVVAGCSIGGLNYASGSTDPSDPGQCCNPTRSPHDWIARLGDAGVYPMSAGPTVNGVALADFDRDGWIDIAFAAADPAPNDPSAIGIWWGRTGGTFEPGPSVGLSGLGYGCTPAWGIAAADLNGDGYPDIVTGVCRDQDPGAMTIFLYSPGPGEGLLWVPSGGPMLIASVFPLRDFDGDGTIDLVLGGFEANFLKGLGTGSFGDLVSFAFPGDAALRTLVAAGSIRNNGLVDYVIGGDTTEQLNVYLSDGRGGFPGQLNIQTGLATHGLAVDDFDGDGRADIAVGGLSGDARAPLSIFLGGGDGTFSPPTTLGAAGGGPVTLVDLDGDGKAEALVADATRNSLSVVWHLADGGTAITALPLDSPPSCVVAGDFNRDKAPDVIVCEGTSVALFENECP